jgi:septum formation protein
VTAVRVLLVSASPRRRAILGMLGLEPRVVEPGAIERRHLLPEPPAAFVVAQAEAKLRTAGALSPGWMALAADTVVVLDGRVMGKPEDPAEAREMLRALSGRTHEVVTGVAVSHADAVAAGWEVTRVAFRTLAEEDVRRYVAGGEPLDKAGAYGIQGAGAALVRGVEGCYFNVVGLPVVKLLELLGEVGLRYDLRGAILAREPARSP